VRGDPRALLSAQAGLHVAGGCSLVKKCEDRDALILTSGVFAGVCSCQGGHSSGSAIIAASAGSRTCSHVSAARRLSVGFECFASPLNTRFSRFCSAFPVRRHRCFGIDGLMACFASRGSATSPPACHAYACTAATAPTALHGMRLGMPLRPARVCVSLSIVLAALHRPGCR